MTFKIIETQEELDQIVSGRVNRVKEKHNEEISSLKSLNKTLKKENESLKEEVSKNAEKYKDVDGKLSDLEGKVATYERESVKTKVAMELGIPFELSGKLSGETEEEIRKDAEILSKFIGQKKRPPLRNPEGGGQSNERNDALREMLKGIK